MRLARTVDVLAMDQDTELRFWGLVSFVGGEIHPRLGSRCWPWRGRRDQAGYGLFQVSPAIPMAIASRIALAFTAGRPLGLDQVTRHLCDNPPCCNPSHIVPGSHADNAQDKVLSGRASTKLTIENVREIRRLWKCGVKQVAIAVMFGVKPSTVNQLIRGRRWTHIPDEPTSDAETKP